MLEAAGHLFSEAALCGSQIEAPAGRGSGFGAWVYVIWHGDESRVAVKPCKTMGSCRVSGHEILLVDLEVSGHKQQMIAETELWDPGCPCSEGAVSPGSGFVPPAVPKPHHGSPRATALHTRIGLGLKVPFFHVRRCDGASQTPVYAAGPVCKWLR